MKGRIVKGIAGFYYVDVPEKGIYECKARGVFRNQEIKPLVGDYAEIDVTDEEAMAGQITAILPRFNELIRPAVANVDQAVVLFAAAKPAPNLALLDHFLVMMQRNHVQTILVFNKSDAASARKMEELAQIYAGCGCRVLFISAKNGEGTEEVRSLLKGRTTVLAGPSGVGKSTLMNAILPEAGMQTGEISQKIGRGRHTTRHAELFQVGENTYLFDTPGFSSFGVWGLEPEELRYYMPEFAPYEGKCRFDGCLHDREPDCAVKEALEAGEISRARYDSYLQMLEILRQAKPY
ncbi:MAG: ribosome small subunit-dependent GTPase A [Lachnospiraceae bacterium]|nr:ribosome small subunit-dependent GTPase A [Lachnospiraceae bacterium]MBR0154049.1 ribosome small subunit-dependent GTPase A [Lachnospiraceae bacterium]